MSERNIMDGLDPAEWWPPSVGDKLRGLEGNPGGPEDDTLFHVVSVFEHDGEAHVTLADWWPHKRRWHYSVSSKVAAQVGLIRRDGTPRLKP